MKKLFSLFCIVFFSIQIFGQRQINVSVGLDNIGLLNLGAQYQIQQSQIGFSCGLVPRRNETFISIAGDYYYHFGKLPKLSNLRPWYGKLGLDYILDSWSNGIDTYIFLNARLGRDFNISHKLGIGMDAGVVVPLLNSKGIGPALGIRVFYKIYAKGPLKSNEV
jgi:hypothetical protein